MNASSAQVPWFLMRIARNNSLLTIVVLAVAVCGCGEGGPKKYPISGTVTSDGKSVLTGVLTFVPVEGGAAVTSSIEADGTFRLQAPAGRYKVGLSSYETSDADGVIGENWEQAFSGKMESNVHAIYEYPETSPLAFTVSETEENNFNIEANTPRRRSRRR